jgi:hypothetical protein
MSKNQINDDICPICKQYMAVRCTGYSKQPFINGKKYEVICHTCWAATKSWSYTEEKSLENCLYTANELEEDGFDIKEAKISIKAIKTSIKKLK